VDVEGRNKRAADAIGRPLENMKRTRFRAPTAVRFRESRLSRADRPARKPWVLGARCLARRAENIAFRTVRAYRLARDREGLVSRSGPGVTASARLPLLGGRRVGPSFSGRGVHPVPSPAGRRRSLTRSRDGRGLPGHRPGRLAARRPLGAGQIDRGVSPAVSLASLRRSLAAPCRPGLPASGPSRFGVGSRRSRHPSRASHRPCGFPASRLRCLIELFVPRAVLWSRRWRRRPCGSFVPGVLRTAHVPGPRPGWFSRPGRWRALRIAPVPATSVGFAHHPSQSWSGLTSRVSAPSFGASRSGPPAVSPSRPTASSIDRGIRLSRRVVGPCRLRLLGFGPAGQPWPRDRRSRYSFCA